MKSNDKKRKTKQDIKDLLGKIDSTVKIRDVNRAVKLWKDVIHFDIYKMTKSHIEIAFYKPVIYFLLKDQQVIYIGETTSLMGRISQHVNSGLKEFDQIRFIEFNGTDSERRQKEKEEILFHKPIFNIKHNKLCFT